MFSRTAVAFVVFGSLAIVDSNGAVREAHAGPVTGPSGPAFYIPPVPLPAGAPGDVIWYRPTKLYLDPARFVPFNADAWTVLYRSTSLAGQPVAVSGTVIVSRLPYAGTRPLLTYAVGTHGMGDRCAPSKWLAAGIDYEGSMIKEAVDKGWVVAVTDYMGLGTPGNHPYVVRELAGRAVLDIARAAARIPGSGISPTAPVGITGYSQGGGASAAAAEIAPVYAPELNIVGAAAGGVPADPQRVADNLDGSLFFGLLAFAAIGLDAAYPELNLASFSNNLGAFLFAKARTDCVSDIAFGYAYVAIRNVTTSSPLITEAWQKRIEENRLGTTAPRVPMHLYHSVLDEIIPYEVGWNLRRDYCAQGVAVEWVTFFFSEHLTGMLYGGPGALSWLADRFAGIRAPNGC